MTSMVVREGRTREVYKRGGNDMRIEGVSKERNSRRRVKE